jgi:hypothetical protein
MAASLQCITYPSNNQCVDAFLGKVLLEVDRLFIKVF